MRLGFVVKLDLVGFEEDGNFIFGSILLNFLLLKLLYLIIFCLTQILENGNLLCHLFNLKLLPIDPCLQP